MKIFSAAQIKKWDAYTIANEPITSVDLMERAAAACVSWLAEKQYTKKNVLIFCGMGNNGGDGLAIARMLVQQKSTVSVYIIDNEKEGSQDFKTNLKKLEVCTFNIHTIASGPDFPPIPKDAVVIDALFGTGLNKPLSGMPAALVAHINNSGAAVIAIDMPSGLFADETSAGNSIITASHTLSFQQYKLAFLLAENDEFCGDVHILDIGLHPRFEQEEESIFQLADKTMIGRLYKPRKKFSHKGSYGHALLAAGSYGMMGAAVLAATACLRSGAGKLTCCVPECGYSILQTAVPEAMCIVNGNTYIENITGIEKFNAVGIGPGIGNYPSHTSLLKTIFQAAPQSAVIDADALNIIAQDEALKKMLPSSSIITPHFKEFERLFGKTGNGFERLQLALQQSREYGIYIVLKGHYTFISTPEGKGYFNPTGNAGMATAGSGDVLCGIITGLLAQSYTSSEACLLGVYLHGLAGDIAAGKNGAESLIARDITDNIGQAFMQLV